MTPERLRELLSYNRSTGVFTNRLSRGKARAGNIAGSLNQHLGYRIICLDGKRYYAHRLAWFYVKGSWPIGGIDHKDRNGDHNWFSNLRLATKAENLANAKLNRRNSSGFKGVSRRRNGWGAWIKPGGVSKFLGKYDTPEQAHAAYTIAAKKHFGKFVEKR